MFRSLLKKKKLVFYTLSFFIFFYLLDLFSWINHIDFFISSLFYSKKEGFSTHIVYTWIFKYAIIPAQIIGLVSLIIFIIAIYRKNWEQYFKPAAYLFFTLVVGSGLVTNVLLKDHWGRARPKQVIQFGGKHTFSPFYLPNLSHKEPLKSFPSGHSTMGFYFFCPYRLAKKYRYNSLKILSLTLFTLLGFLLSLARLAQGGHFLTDIIAGAFVMISSAYIFEKVFWRTSPRLQAK